jgi:hypothetical protein
VIDFDDHGRRTFVTTMVSLEPSSTPAPERSGSAGRRRSSRAAGSKKSAS